MRTLLSGLLLSSLLSSAALARTQTQTLDFSGAQALEVNLEFGNVRVEVGEGVPQLRATLEGEARYSVRKSGGVLRVEGVGAGNCTNCKLELTLTIPAGKRVKLHTGAGNAALSGPALRAELSTDAGNVSAERTGSAPLTLSSDAGNVSAKATAGALTLSSGAGNVVLDDVALPTASRSRAKTDAGNVTVRGLRGTVRVLASSEAGAVEVPRQFRNPEVRTVLELSSGAGNVTVR